MEKHEAHSDSNLDFSKLTHLTESFSNFNDLIEKLNDSYQDLEKRFESLNSQLEETNYNLRHALFENQKVRSFLHELTEAVPSGIVVYDLEGRITLLNRAAAALLEINEEIAHRQGLGLIEDSRPELSALQTIESRLPFISEEKQITLKSGHKVVVSFSTALMYDQDRNVIGALELYHDISKICHLENELIRVKTLAALGEIAATVAHEVRNPLGGILGFAALLRRDLGDDDPRSQMVDKIIKGVENLDRSVSSLLSYAQEMRPALTEVKLKPFVEEIIANFQMNLYQNGESSNVDLIVSPESLEWNLDPEQIRQCLFNLLLNAHQAQRVPSEIRLSIIGDNKLSLVVTDFGTGIEDEVKRKLFTPFFTTRKTGTGLGLATVKKLILSHKGEIRVDSEVGKGTEITLEIPANLH